MLFSHAILLKVSTFLVPLARSMVMMSSSSGSSSSYTDGDSYTDGSDSDSGGESPQTSSENESSSSSMGRSSSDSESGTRAVGGTSPTGVCNPWDRVPEESWIRALPILQTDGVTMLLPCAGLDGPGRALRSMGIQHRLAGLWETNQKLMPFLRKMYHGQGAKMHVGDAGDVTQIKPKDVPLATGLVAGPPCQWVSTIGSQMIWADPRSAVFVHLIEWCASLAHRGLKFFVLENVFGLSMRRRGTKRSPLDIILKKLKKKLPRAWVVNVWVCNSWSVAQSRKRIYIMGHVGADLTPQPNLPRASLARLLCNGLPNVRDSELCESRRLKLRKYMELLKPHLESSKLKGTVACFSADRNPQKSKFAQIRLDDASPCLKSNCPYFVVSLGEGGGKSPSIYRFLHPAELCLLQGISPRSVPQSIRVSVLKRALGNAMSVPVVGAVLNAVMCASLDCGQVRVAKRKRG